MQKTVHFWSNLPNGCIIYCGFCWNIWISTVSGKWKALAYELIFAVTILRLRPHSQRSHRISPGSNIWFSRLSANPVTAMARYFQRLSKTNLDKVHRTILLVWVHWSDGHKTGGFVLLDFMQAIRSSIDLESPCASVWGCYLNRQCASCLWL